MVKEILYTTALDKDEKIVHINNAEKGNKYYCPECKKEFILRKSGNTGKGSKRPHFAHNELTSNCTPEGVLHLSFKKMTVNLLEQYKSENKPLIMNWTCNYCSKKNIGNLLENVVSIKEEYNLNVCQPDIALLDQKSNVIAVIEIVVTHEPEKSVLQYYDENNIILIQINLSSEEELNNIEGRITKPDIVDYCFINPMCSESGRHKIRRDIRFIINRCSRCWSPIEKYFIEIGSVFGRYRTLDFAENEINFVKSKRANIRIRKNKDRNEEYPIFYCLKCERMMSRGRRKYYF